MLEPAVAQSLTEQTTAGQGGESPGLLIAQTCGILPHMAVNGKAVCHIGPEVNDDKACKPGGGGHKGDGRQVAGAEKGNGQEGHKEDQRCAEVAHQRQAAHAIGGKDQGEDQVSPGKHPVQRGGAYQNKDHFDQLRGLEGDGADDHPVFCAKEPLTQQDVESKQRRRSDGRRPAKLLCQVQVPQDNG